MMHQFQAFASQTGCNVSVYDPATGRIESQLSIQKEVFPHYEKSGIRLVQGWHDAATHYVSKGEVVQRPANPARLDGMTLRDLPTPCSLVIDGTRYECTEPTVELEFPVPKTYSVTVDAFPHQDATFEVTVK